MFHVVTSIAVGSHFGTFAKIPVHTSTEIDTMVRLWRLYTHMEWLQHPMHKYVCFLSTFLCCGSVDGVLFAQELFCQNFIFGLKSFGHCYQGLKKSSIDGNCYLVYLWALLVYKIVVLVVS
jgi:hypothetical protein